MPKPAAAAATTTQRQSGERHHHHHHHHHHRRREDAARRQQEDLQREEQQGREAAEESARQGPISMTDFEKRCETIKIGANEALLWVSDYRKLDPRRKKRRLGGLLTELQEKKGELTDQYMALADLDVDTSAFDSDRKRKALLSNAFSKLTAVQRAVGELTQERDSLGEGKGSPEAKRRYFQEKLKSQYPVNCDLHLMVKSVKALPENSQADTEEKGPDGLTMAEKFQGYLEKGSDLLEEDSALKSVLDGFSDAIGMVVTGYKLFVGIKNMVNTKKSGEKVAWSEIEEAVENATSLISDLLQKLEDLGLKALAKVIPIIGTVFEILMTVINGVGHVLSMITSIKNRSHLVTAERGLEARMMKNREKEAQYGNQIQLGTEIRRDHWYSRKKSEHLVEGRENREAQRQQLRASVAGRTAPGQARQNIYMQKVQLKRERSRLLASENPDAARVAELDSQIGKLRMAQDADRLGVATEGKVKQNNRIKDATIGLVTVATSLASQIAKLCPGIGTAVGEGIDTVMGIFTTSRKVILKIISLLPSHKQREQRKEARREGLADTILDQIDMLGSPEFALETLENQPADTQDENILKAASKGYDDLRDDLQYSLGISPKSLRLLDSRSSVRRTLAAGFAAQ